MGFVCWLGNVNHGDRFSIWIFFYVFLASPSLFYSIKYIIYHNIPYILLCTYTRNGLGGGRHIFSKFNFDPCSVHIIPIWLYILYYIRGVCIIIGYYYPYHWNDEHPYGTWGPPVIRKLYSGYNKKNIYTYTRCIKSLSNEASSNEFLLSETLTPHGHFSFLTIVSLCA